MINNSLHDSAIKLDIAFHDKVPFSITVARKKIRQINLTSESEWELEADCDLRLRLFRGGGTLRLLAEVDPVGGGYN